MAPARQEEGTKEGARKIMRIIRRKMRNRGRTAGGRVEDVDGARYVARVCFEELRKCAAALKVANFIFDVAGHSAEFEK